ncbi:MAG: hypothetical protein AAGA18_13545 [Verrucomicrobiota bacterium]
MKHSNAQKKHLAKLGLGITVLGTAAFLTRCFVQNSLRRKEESLARLGAGESTFERNI